MEESFRIQEGSQVTVYGYARVSTKGQDLALQRDALKDYGVDHRRIYADVGTGTNMKRPRFESMDAKLERGDTVVVWKLDRLGRSMDELIEYVISLGKRGVEVKSLTQDIDTTTAAGKAMFYLFAVFSEMEHEFIVERTMAGLEAARKKGNKGGRPVVDVEKVELAMKMRESGEFSVKEILKATGLSQGTYYKYVNEARDSSET